MNKKIKYYALAFVVFSEILLRTNAFRLTEDNKTYRSGAVM